jgi:hypothetical protein
MAAALQSLLPKLGLSKKALLLGAGFVTKPTLKILSDAGIDVTVGVSIWPLSLRKPDLLERSILPSRCLPASPMPIQHLSM